MFSHLVHVLALSLAVSASKPQRVLGYHEEPSNFLQSSIFGRKDLAAQSLPEPVILKPSYESRDFQDNDEFAAQTFAHLPFIDCTNPANTGTFDVGIVGHPFDLGVSYRPGARFGPNGARQGARRLSPAAGWRYVTWKVWLK